jgi:hypothetical protein
LYKAKFGQEVDSQDEGDGDIQQGGVMWTVTRGTPQSMSQLERRLSDVKALYEAKFGEEVDSD